MKASCPTCAKPMSRRWARKQGLAPRVPARMGPRCREALEEAQDGWCAMCDELPVCARKGAHRFTCGRDRCKKDWRNLASMDWRDRQQEAQKAGSA